MFAAVFFVLVLLAPTTAQELAPGRWIIGEPEGDDFELVLELERDGTGVLTNLRSPGEGDSLTLEPTQPPLYRLPDGYLMLLSEEEALIWMGGQAGWARRMGGELPPEMLGEWQSEDISLNLDVDSFRLQGGEGDALTATVYPVLPLGSGTDAVILPEKSESKLVHFRLLPGEVLMVWRHDEDEIWLLKRPGAAPGWVEETRSKVESVDKSSSQ